MHEKVLRASTLDGAFKEEGEGKKKHPTKDDSMESVSKNANALVQALRVLVCHSDLTAPGSGKPAAH